MKKIIGISWEYLGKEEEMEKNLNGIEAILKIAKWSNIHRYA